MKTKACRVCKRWMPDTVEFFRAGNGRSVTANICIRCDRVRKTEYRDKVNPDRERRGRYNKSAGEYLND